MIRRALAILLLAIGNSGAPAPLPESDTPAERGFAFCAARESGDEKAGWNRPLVFGFLRALSPEQSETLSAALVDSNRRWEARANPFLEDLEDGDPDVHLEQWLVQGPPVARAALAAARPLRCGGDGWCVRVIERGAPCPAGFAPMRDGTPEMKRARFINWPFGYASWLRARTEADAASAASALREAATTSTRIGLVLHVSDDQATRESSVELRDSLLRHESLRRAATRTENGDVEAGEATARFPAKLDRLDVVVLPRFEVVRDPASLAREVTAIAPKLSSL